MGVRCFVPVLSREFGKLTSGELKASSATPILTPPPFFLLLIMHTICFPLASPKHSSFSHFSCSCYSQSLGWKVSMQPQNVTVEYGLRVYNTNSFWYQNIEVHQDQYGSKVRIRFPVQVQRSFFKNMLYIKLYKHCTFQSHFIIENPTFLGFR